MIRWGSSSYRPSNGQRQGINPPARQNMLAPLEDRMPGGLVWGSAIVNVQKEEETPSLSPSPTPSITKTVTPTPSSSAPAPSPSLTPTPTPSPTPSSYLLDTYGSAKVAYSLRKLSASQTNAITIRRSNDNATLDVGFVGEDLDTSAITSFVGANNAFITKWWDQSGNGNDLSGLTTTQQPLIVSGGTIQLAVNSKPAISFDGSNNYLTLTTAITTVNTLTETWVIDRKGGAELSVGLANSSSTNPFYSFWFSDGNVYFRPGAASGVSISAGNIVDDYLLFSVFSGNTWTLTVNNGIPTSGAYTGSGLSLDVFGKRSTSYNKSLQQEYILWETNQTSNQTNIQNNINNYYSVY